MSKNCITCLHRTIEKKNNVIVKHYCTGRQYETEIKDPYNYYCYRYFKI